MRSRLIANDVGNDAEGDYVIQLIRRHDIETQIKIRKGVVTPYLLDISDCSGTRKILTFMPGIAGKLLNADLKFMDGSSLAYIDLYSEIQKASLRAINYATREGIPLFVNLSHDSLLGKTALLSGREQVTILQASLDSSNPSNPRRLASILLRKTRAKVVLVTLGSKGALCATASKVIQIPAYKVKQIRTTFGAGAAFSGGFAFGYLNDWKLEECLRFASGLGALTCTLPNGLSEFSSEDVLRFIES